MENHHNIQFSHLSDSTFLDGEQGTGKTATLRHERDERLASGRPVLDPVSFIEPLPNLAELYASSHSRKVRWA